MLKKATILILFVCIALTATRFYNVSHPIDTPLPLIEIEQSDLSLSDDLTSFSGKWEGIWGGQIGRFIGKGIDTTVVVEKIDSSQASVILSFGSNADLGIVQGFNRFTVPVISAETNTLAWDWNKWGVSFEFTLSDDRTELIGNAKVLNTGEIFKAKLRKVELEQNQIAKNKPIVPYRYKQPLSLNDGWSTVNLDKTGFSEGKLSKLSQSIQLGEYKNIHALLIEDDGKLVYEQYFEGEDETGGGQLGHVVFAHDTLHDLRSISKSVTSILLGIAFKGELEQAIQRSLSTYFNELDDEDKNRLGEVSLKQALTMTSGLKWNETWVPYSSFNNDSNRMSRVVDPIKMVLSQPITKTPGKDWAYNGGLTELLAEIVQRKTGKDLKEFAEKALFEPLGISEYQWIGPPSWLNNRVSAAAGLRLRARDLAKIGSLYLHNGRWNDVQVVPEEWVDLSTQRHVDDIGLWSANGVWGYGFQWWHGNFVSPKKYSVIAGHGYGGQRVFIVPSEKLVITIFAGHYGFHVSDETEILHRIVTAKINDQ